MVKSFLKTHTSLAQDVEYVVVVPNLCFASIRIDIIGTISVLELSSSIMGTTNSQENELSLKINDSLNSRILEDELRHIHSVTIPNHVRTLHSMK
jgi:hypothetical protein